MAARKPVVMVNGVLVQLPSGDSLLGAGGLAGFTSSITPEAGGVGAYPAHTLTPDGADSNIGLVLAPKGFAYISAQLPDGTVAGGDPRGNQAVDLQLNRLNASEVASGSGSFAAGTNNTASGSRALAIGNQNFSTGTYSACFGSGNSATGTGSICFGFNNISTGLYSSCFGTNNEADANYAAAFGANTTVRSIAAAMAEGSSNGLGVQQMRRIALRRDTNNNIAFQLNSFGTTGPTSINSVVLPDTSAYYCRVRVLARNLSTNTCKSWIATGLFRRGVGVGTVVMVGSSVTSEFGDAAMSAASVSLGVNTSLGCMTVMVTGLSGVTVRWVAQVETIEAA